MQLVSIISLEISCSFRKWERLPQMTGYTRSSVTEQAMCSGSRPGHSAEEITKLKASTTRLCIHRWITSTMSGWHSRLPPSKIMRSIKLSSARLAWESTWNKTSKCGCHRDIFVCFRTGADAIIHDQRLCGRWYSAWDSLFMAWNSHRTFAMALSRTSWSRLGSWHHVSTEDCSCSMIRIRTWLLPQSFCKSNISSPLLTRAWLGRSRTRCRRHSGCMISGMSPSVLAWTPKPVRSIRRSTSISPVTFWRSLRSPQRTSTGQLPRQLQWSFRRGSPTNRRAIRPYTNWWSEAWCMQWPPLGTISHIPSEFSASSITTSAMSVW